jgi:hypothetical protein
MIVVSLFSDLRKGIRTICIGDLKCICRIHGAMEEEMSVVTVRLPEDQHQRLKAMAQARGISLNKLFEHLTAQALTENDIEIRYRRMAATGSAARGLELLDKLDRSEQER